MKMLVINGSSRDHGNTEILTEHLLTGVPSYHVHLREHHIKPIVDQRHEDSGFRDVNDDYESIIQKVLEHDLLFFATPVYWYGMSGQMKNFIDRWSQSLRNKTYDLRSAMAQKEAFFLVVGGDQIHRKALPVIEQFYYICDFLHIKPLGYLIGQGSKPGEVIKDHRALAESKYWNKFFQDKVNE